MFDPQITPDTERGHSGSSYPEAGNPPPAVAALLSRIHNARSIEATENVSPGAQEEKFPEPDSPVEPALPHVSPPTFSCSTQQRRLLERLNQPSSSLVVRINGVELTLDVLDVDKTNESICCLVKNNGMKCRLPRSQDVFISLEGSDYHVAFLGAWHTFDWLGVQMAVFTILPDSESDA